MGLRGARRGVDLRPRSHAARGASLGEARPAAPRRVFSARERHCPRHPLPPPRQHRRVHASGSRVRVKDTEIIDISSEDPTTHPGGRPGTADVFPYLPVGVHCMGADVTIEGGRIHNCPAGVLADGFSDKDPMLHMHGVTMSAYAFGVSVFHGACATVTGCKLHGREGLWERSLELVVREMVGGRYEDWWVGLQVHQTVAPVVRDCQFRGNAVDVICNSSLDKGLRVEGCSMRGLCGEGCEMPPGYADPSGRSMIVRGGRAEVIDCALSRCEIALDCGDEGTVVEVRGCTIGPRVSQGVSAVNSATVSVSGSAFDACQEAAGVFACGTLSMTDCECNGGMHGMYHHGGGGTLSAARVRVRGAQFGASTASYSPHYPETGLVGALRVDAPKSSLVLRDCEIHGGETAVQVKDVPIWLCTTAR